MFEYSATERWPDLRFAVWPDFLLGQVQLDHKNPENLRPSGTAKLSATKCKIHQLIPLAQLHAFCELLPKLLKMRASVVGVNSPLALAGCRLLPG